MKRCIICKNNIEKYVAIEKKYLELPLKYGRKQTPKSETLNAEEYSCPFCYALDRDRLCSLFLEELLEKTNALELNILDIAPSGAIKKFVYSNSGRNTNYYTADLYMEDVDYRLDIQNMKDIKNERFHLVICCHVLEHVKDDIMAMKEIYRILDRNGLAIILVPLDLDQTQTDEEWGLTEAENWRRFGQGDHVRKYAKIDFINRLKLVGFKVNEMDKVYFGEEKYQQNALTETSTLYVVNKELNNFLDKSNLIHNFVERNMEDYNLINKVKGEVNYWIDCCEENNGQIIIWGWSYFVCENSKNTKAKIIFQNISGFEEKVFGFDLQKREDIQNTFGRNEDNYNYSGIALNYDLDIFKGEAYRIYLKLNNSEKENYLLINEEFYINR